MNTGIQHAYNLAWKLALVLDGAPPVALLDSYESERRPVGMDVVARTRAASEAYGTEHVSPCFTIGPALSPKSMASATRVSSFVPMVTLAGAD
jgi:2-polyprenyl-6-methoxyphenol hydroxylase-like FAD-dependent oxidoreductase